MQPVFTLSRALVALAIAGAALGVWAVTAGRTEAPLVAPQRTPASAPRTAASPAYIGASGIVEAESENVAVGASVAGVVAQVFVAPGDVVRAGAPLFEVDARDARSELAVRVAATDTARQRAAALEAALVEARAQQTNERRRAERAEQLAEQRALSQEDADARRAAAEVADARVARAAAELAEARAAAAEAQARADQARTELERRRTLAPRDGTVLRVDVQPGEFAPAGTLDSPLVTLGAMTTLHARVDVDESDIPRFLPGEPAELVLRGAADARIRARFVRVEPLVVPKRQIGGNAVERVDTRVLQVIYAFEPDRRVRAYPGQRLDAYVPAVSD